VLPTEGIIAGAAVAQSVAEIPQTDDSPGGNGGIVPNSQMSAETVQGRVEVGNDRQHFAALRPEAPNAITGKHVELEDQLEAVEKFMWHFMDKRKITSYIWL
jgi:hypothetical protein